VPLATRARTVMTLSDVAGLARVARPVVTMWRERPLVAGIERPFPEAVDRASRVEHFDANDIVRWLTDTGRGKNPDAAADAAAYAMPRALLDGAEPSPAALDGAEALLCLRMLRGIDLGTMGADDLLDLAEEADPDDTVLFAEIESLGERATPLAAWIDNLVDAAYGALIAFDRLTARRRLTAPQRRVQLRPEADALIAQIAAALVADLGEGAVVTDATGGPTDLVRAVMDRIGEGTSTAVRVHTRHGRRRALVADWPQAETPHGPGLVLAQLPSVARPDASAAEILQAVDDLQLDHDDTQRAVFVAPSDVLCDALGDATLDGVRSSIIRLGRLRAAVRLPRGLLVGSPRQALGLWVIGPERNTVPLAERWVATADLSDALLTPDVLTDLATDIVAVMGERPLGRAHAFRFARVTMTASLLAGGGAIVPVGVRPARLNVVSSASIAAQVAALVAEVGETVERVGAAGRLHVGPSTRQPGMTSCSLADALTSRAATVVKGARFDPHLATAQGPVRVLGVADLSDPVAPRRGVDPLEVEVRHPAARRTEPGDVVFCTAPRPASVVDRDGYSFVAYPARVLRCRPGSGLVPEAVAATINAQPARSRDWRAWHVPTVDPADADTLGVALRYIEDERRAAYQRLSRLHNLTTRLVDGVATRAITVTAPDPTIATPTEGR